MNFIFLLWLVLSALFLLTTIYLAILALASLRRPTPVPDLPPVQRFALVIPAHNEERVIGDLIENLWQLRYPRELYDVYVVADNCEDDTAAVARQRGATVIERHESGRRGKNHALRWAFAQVLALAAHQGRDYDAFVVIDADNAVSLDFLQKMNNRLCQGERLLQGYLATKNPDDSLVSRVIALQYIVTNRLWQLGKERLRLSCALGGTGTCITVDLIKEYGWNGESLTEDLEFEIRMALEGVRSAWVHEAVVYDEKPTAFRVAWRQRQRWMIGQFDVLRRYLPSLLIESLRKRDLNLLDQALYLLQPLWLLVIGGYAILENALIILRLSQAVTAGGLQSHVPDLVSVTLPFVAYLLLYIPLALYLEKIPARPRLLPMVIQVLLVPAIWFFIVLSSLLHLGERKWVHTPHSAKLDPRIRIREGLVFSDKQVAGPTLTRRAR